MRGNFKPINGQKLKGLLLGIAAALLVTVRITAGQSQPPESQLMVFPLTLTATAKDSIDKATGLIIAPGFEVVKTTCVKCHSPKLITEKRATREGWIATIRWMQHSQGLWDLGKAEPEILDYLAKNYAPQNEGRRPPLKITEWYKLSE